MSLCQKLQRNGKTHLVREKQLTNLQLTRRKTKRNQCAIFFDSKCCHVPLWGIELNCARLINICEVYNNFVKFQLNFIHIIMHIQKYIVMTEITCPLRQTSDKAWVIAALKINLGKRPETRLSTPLFRAQGNNIRFYSDISIRTVADNRIRRC